MGSRFADAVIVAAGASSRMGGVDKLAEPLLGRPLLAWSVEAMARSASVDRIVVVTRADQVDAFRTAGWLASAADGRAEVVAGGERRSDSVRAGVAATHASVVLVHDGARPLVSPELADAVASAAAEHGAAVPALAVVDSLKRADDNAVQYAVDRDGLVRAQTPQGARRELLVDAIASAGDSSYTDEAALLEAARVPVAIVPGESANIKVTDGSDLEIVRAIAASRAGSTGGDGTSSIRLGFGEDTHGFGPGDGLMLGGVLFGDAPRLYGHSDGDVVLHALATAILAACSLGDLGRLFPPSDPTTSGIASAQLVSEAVKRADEAGWVVARAQLAIVGARPRLGTRVEEMRDAIAALIGADVDAIAVTASTGNLSGPEGAGRVVRATALVTVRRR